MVKSAPLPLRRPRPDVRTVVSLLVLLAAAAAMRLVNLDVYTGKFDEGIRAEQLLLMSAGFRPVRDIFASQGPLSLDIFYGPYLAFGQSLAAARAAVVIYSLLGLMAIFWVGGLAGGRLGAVLATALLVLSPLYLKNSRLALLEVPALVPGIVALGAALVYQLNGERRWLILSAVCLAVALLIKPMVVGVVVPIGLALLLRSGRRPGDFVLFGLVSALVGAGVVLLYGPEQLWQQVVTYRASAREASDWSLRENWSILREELRDEQLPLYALAAAGGVCLAVTRPRWGLPLAAWPLANLGLLLLYSPLQFKHAVILLPPIALVIGAALATAGGATHASPAVAAGAGREEAARPWVALGRRMRRPSGVLLVALALVGWYATSLPAVLRQDWVVMNGPEGRVETYDDEVQLVSELSGPADFVIVDEPIVAFNSRRMVPPNLVDTSSYRIRSGTLTGSELVEAAERFDVKLLFLFSDGLRDIDKFAGHVDERFRTVRIWERQNAKDRALLLREDADLEAARASVAGVIDRPLRAEFGDDLRLLGYNLSREELRPGSSATLTLHWEAIRPMATDYSVIARLEAEAGEPESQSQRGLGGGGEGTSAWEPGRWLIRSQSLAVPARFPAGEYRLYVGLYDSRSRTSPPLTAGGERGAAEVLLGRIRVSAR